MLQKKEPQVSVHEMLEENVKIDVPVIRELCRVMCSFIGSFVRVYQQQCVVVSIVWKFIARFEKEPTLLTQE